MTSDEKTKANLPDTEKRDRGGGDGSARGPEPKSDAAAGGAAPQEGEDVSGSAARSRSIDYNAKS